MPANIETRNGVYHFRAIISGKFYRRSTGYRVDGGRRALELAQRRAAQIENDLRAGIDGFLKKPVPTFGTWAHTFLLAYYPGKYTERTLLRRPVETWGAKTLDAITRSDIELFFRERQAQGAKGGTLERERVLLKRLFRAAVDDGVLQANPMQALRAFKTTPKTRVMSRDEETRIRAALSPSWNRFLTVALTTGLRLGELLALRPSDVFRPGAITWLHVRPESNKTRTAREVPLRPETMLALAEQQGNRKDDVLYWPVTPNAAKVMMKRVCARLKIEPSISVHDLRRTFATRCAEAKMYPKHLQLILGHKDISTTMKFYVHEERRSLADAIREATL